ncbi:PhoH family protein [Nanoarchaeota archaeon]
MTEEYRHIFIPLTDVYELGGTEAFKHLERSPEKGGKNLMVVPMTFVSNLDDIITREYSEGAEAALKVLKDLDQTPLDDHEGVRVSELTQGLDLAFIDKPALDKDHFSITNLVKKIQEVWKQDTHKPELISSRDKYHIKFKGRGIKVRDPQFLQVTADIVNEGLIDGNPSLLAELRQNNLRVPLEQAIQIMGRELYPNQFLRFAGKKSGYEYARVAFEREINPKTKRVTGMINARLELLRDSEHGRQISVGKQIRDNVLGIGPLDMEQYLAMQYGLLNPNVDLFFLCGSKGSGKTLMTYACVLDLLLHYDKGLRQKRGMKGDGKGGFFKQTVLLKPNSLMGGKDRDVGALPGDLYKKLKPFLNSYIDAHTMTVLGDIFPFDDLLRHPKYDTDFGAPRSEFSKNKIQDSAYLPNNREVMEMTYSGFMRGRSFSDTLIILDETQSWTPYEVKTILDRAGLGCKALVLGDPAQIDNPECTPAMNGLTHAINHYVGNHYVALINLTRNYRHPMSEDSEGWNAPRRGR